MRSTNRSRVSAAIKYCASVLLFSVAIAACQSLPDPMRTATPDFGLSKPAELPDPMKTVTVASSVSSIQTPDPATARMMSERVVSGLDSLSQTIQQNLVVVRRMGERVAQLESERQRLVAEEKKVLDDYRTGCFCSQCGRAKSEFPTEADFWEHIAEGRNQGRHAVSASPEQMAQKRAEYEGKFAGIDKELREARQAVAEKESSNRSAYFQIQEGMNLWQAAQQFEKDALAIKQESEQHQFRSQLSEADRQLERLAASMRSSNPNSDQFRELAAAKQTWEKVRENVSEQAHFSASSYASDAQEAQQRGQSQYSKIATFMGRTEDYLGQVRVSGDFLPTLNFAVKNFAVYTSEDQLGVRYQLGTIPKLPAFVTIGFEATNTPISIESKDFLDLCGKLRLEVGYRTTYNPDATVSSGFFGGIGSASSQKGTPIKISPVRRDEQSGSTLPLPKP